MMTKTILLNLSLAIMLFSCNSSDKGAALSSNDKRDSLLDLKFSYENMKELIPKVETVLDTTTISKMESYILVTNDLEGKTFREIIKEAEVMVK